MKTNVFVLYHANCLDGLGAKYAAWKKFNNSSDYEATYIPVEYNKPLPNNQITNDLVFEKIEIGETFYNYEDDYTWVKVSSTEASRYDTVNKTVNNDKLEFELDTIVLSFRFIEVYILDFSYPRDVLEALKTRVNKLLVLDHHKTAQEALEGLEYAIFDMNKSGCVLAWEYFHPDINIPQLLLYVQDRDLWKFKLPLTEQLLIAFDAKKEDMLQWDLYCRKQNSDTPYLESLNHLKEVGFHLIDFRDTQIKEVVKRTQAVQYKGHRVGIANNNTNISETCHAIYENEELAVDYAMTFYYLNDHEVRCDFRSKKGTVDVSEIASALGGGGHPSAAGATITPDLLEQIITGSIPD